MINLGGGFSSTALALLSFLLALLGSCSTTTTTITTVAAFANQPLPPITTSIKAFGIVNTPLSCSARTTAPLSMSSSTETAAGPNIEVISKPDKEFLEKKGVFSWGTWGCGVSKFPWTYDQTESCYLLKGKVTVTPTDGRPPATFGAGDFVTFPAGMSCTWDVSEAVEKHFMFY